MSQSNILADRILDPNAPKLQNEYIMAFPIEKKPKTWVYGIVSMRQGCKLGKVKWHAPWRQYWFEPEIDTGFNWKCMEDISKFVKELMDERKVQRSLLTTQSEKKNIG